MGERMRTAVQLVVFVAGLVGVGISWRASGKRAGIEIGRAMERCETSGGVYLREAVEVRGERTHCVEVRP